MASVQEIRQRLRGQRIEALRSSLEPLLATGRVDDVIGPSQGRWLERQRGDDPWRWRGPWWASKLTSIAVGFRATAATWRSRPSSGRAECSPGEAVDSSVDLVWSGLVWGGFGV
jgi:hypothetical protein